MRGREDQMRGPEGRIFSSEDGIVGPEGPIHTVTESDARAGGSIVNE
jgi:hypothetical protein